jgi:Transposase and inactivated derivatives
MRKMGIQAVYRKKSLSVLGQAVYVKPYLLRGLNVDHRNQVWSIDITYIPMKKGFMYLTAIIDVYSRFIVGWSLHNTLDASNCIEVLQTAIRCYGAPEIINSDQGCQFTYKEWAAACAEHPEMKVSRMAEAGPKTTSGLKDFGRL